MARSQQKNFHLPNKKISQPINHEAVIQSEERYRAFIEQSSEGIWRFELEKPTSIKTSVKKQIEHFYKYAYLAECNNATAKMYGFKKASDIVGARLGEFLVEDDPQNQDYLRAFIKSNYHLTNAESQEIDKYGNQLVFQNNLIGIVENGYLLRAWGTQRNITNQKKAQVALQESEERLRLALEAGKLGIWDWDIKSGKISWSEKIYELHGLKPEEFSGKMEDFIKLIHPEDIKNLAKEINIAKKRIGRFTFEFRTIHPDGTIKWLSTDGQAISDKNGKAIRMLGATFDITERKQMEMNAKLLSEASKILSSSLDYNKTLSAIGRIVIPYLADWIIIDLVQNGVIKRVAVEHVNPRFRSLTTKLKTKYPPNLLKNFGVPNNIKLGKSELTPYISDDLLHSASQNNEHFRILKKLGFTSGMCITLKSQGRVIGAMTFVYGVSHRTYNTSDFLIAQELASRISLALENARLFKNEQMAVNLRDEFISVASHELKTPLTSLKMYTQLSQKLLKPNDEPKLKKYLTKMDQQVNKLTLLIRDLLNVSKMQLGRLEFHEEYFDLQEVIKDTIDVTQAAHETHTIKLKGNVKGKVCGDRDRIEQVINNLLNNAIKYSPYAKEIIVSVRQNPNQTKVSIKDFGIGIEKKHIDKIFHRFYRVSNLKEETFPGLGIGLYISYEIIKRHNGELTVTSIKGKGSTFTFTIPQK